MDMLKNIEAHRIYKKNSNGVDYFMGDLHGNYDLFIEILKKINFDKSKDRIFSVGDLIDRGDESFECLMLSQNEWFIPVLGNHEEMLISSIDNKYIRDIWGKNGGGWWELLDENDKNKAVTAIIEEFTITATIETCYGSVGLVHADYLESSWPINHSKLNKELLKKILWGRTTISEKKIKDINGVDLIISGHTPLKNPELIGMHVFLDTGCGHFPNELINHPKLTVAVLTETGIVCHMLGRSNYQMITLG